MSLLLKEKTMPFLLPNEGLHIARCYLLVDLGDQFSQYYQNTLCKVLIGWEFPLELMENGKPFIQMQRYTASITEKSNLRPLLESWRGRPFSKAEREGFALKNILGSSCYVITKHVLNLQNNQRWSKVISVCHLPESVTCPPPINSPIHFDLDDYSESRYLAVPEGIRKIINLRDLKFKTELSESHHEPLASQTTDYYPYHVDEPQPDVEL